MSSGRRTLCYGCIFSVLLWNFSLCNPNRRSESVISPKQSRQTPDQSGSWQRLLGTYLAQDQKSSSNVNPKAKTGTKGSKKWLSALDIVELLKKHKLVRTAGRKNKAIQTNGGRESKDVLKVLNQLASAKKSKNAQLKSTSGGSKARSEAKAATSSTVMNFDPIRLEDRLFDNPMVAQFEPMPEVQNSHFPVANPSTNIGMAAEPVSEGVTFDRPMMGGHVHGAMPFKWEKQQKQLRQTVPHQEPVVALSQSSMGHLQHRQRQEIRNTPIESSWQSHGRPQNIQQHRITKPLENLHQSSHHSRHMQWLQQQRKTEPEGHHIHHQQRQNQHHGQHHQEQKQQMQQTHQHAQQQQKHHQHEHFINQQGHQQHHQQQHQVGPQQHKSHPAKNQQQLTQQQQHQQHAQQMPMPEHVMQQNPNTPIEQKQSQAGNPQQQHRQTRHHSSTVFENAPQTEGTGGAKRGKIMLHTQVKNALIGNAMAQSMRNHASSGGMQQLFSSFSSGGQFVPPQQQFSRSQVTNAPSIQQNVQQSIDGPNVGIQHPGSFDFANTVPPAKNVGKNANVNPTKPAVNLQSPSPLPSPSLHELVSEPIFGQPITNEPNPNPQAMRKIDNIQVMTPNGGAQSNQHIGMMQEQAFSHRGNQHNQGFYQQPQSPSQSALDAQLSLIQQGSIVPEGQAGGAIVHEGALQDPLTGNRLQTDIRTDPLEQMNPPPLLSPVYLKPQVTVPPVSTVKTNTQDLSVLQNLVAASNAQAKKQNQEVIAYQAPASTVIDQTNTQTAASASDILQPIEVSGVPKTNTKSNSFMHPTPGQGINGPTPAGQVNVESNPMSGNTHNLRTQNAITMIRATGELVPVFASPQNMNNLNHQSRISSVPTVSNQWHEMRSQWSSNGPQEFNTGTLASSSSGQSTSQAATSVASAANPDPAQAVFDAMFNTNNRQSNNGSPMNEIPSSGIIGNGIEPVAANTAASSTGSVSVQVIGATSQNGNMPFQPFTATGHDPLFTGHSSIPGGHHQTTDLLQQINGQSGHIDQLPSMETTFQTPDPLGQAIVNVVSASFSNNQKDPSQNPGPLPALDLNPGITAVQQNLQNNGQTAFAEHSQSHRITIQHQGANQVLDVNNQPSFVPMGMAGDAGNHVINGNSGVQTLNNELVMNGQGLEVVSRHSQQTGNNQLTTNNRGLNVVNNQGPQPIVNNHQTASRHAIVNNGVNVQTNNAQVRNTQTNTRGSNIPVTNTFVDVNQQHGNMHQINNQQHVTDTRFGALEFGSMQQNGRQLNNNNINGNIEMPIEQQNVNNVQTISNGLNTNLNNAGSQLNNNRQSIINEFSTKSLDSQLTNNVQTTHNTLTNNHQTINNQFINNQQPINDQLNANQQVSGQQVITMQIINDPSNNNQQLNNQQQLEQSSNNHIHQLNMNEQINNQQTMNNQLNNIQTMNEQINNQQTLNSQFNNIQTMNEQINNQQTLNSQLNNNIQTDQLNNNQQTMNNQLNNIQTMNEQINNQQTLNSQFNNNIQTDQLNNNQQTMNNQLNNIQTMIEQINNNHQDVNSQLNNQQTVDNALSNNIQPINEQINHNQQTMNSQLNNQQAVNNQLNNNVQIMNEHINNNQLSMNDHLNNQHTINNQLTNQMTVVSQSNSNQQPIDSQLNNNAHMNNQQIVNNQHRNFILDQHTSGQHVPSSESAGHMVGAGSGTITEVLSTLQRQEQGQSVQSDILAQTSQTSSSDSNVAGLNGQSNQSSVNKARLQARIKRLLDAGLNPDEILRLFRIKSRQFRL